MKLSTGLSVALLGLCAQLSSSTPTRERTINTTTTAHIQIQHSSNKTLDGHWAYVNPSSSGNGVLFQFTWEKSKATNFSIDNTYLAGYKTDYVAGSTNAEGTPSGDAVYMSPKDLLIQGGEPIVSVEVNNVTGVVSLSDALGDGTYRHLPQACFVSSSTLHALVLGEEYFDSDNCANITLYWRPIEN